LNVNYHTSHIFMPSSGSVVSNSEMSTLPLLLCGVWHPSPLHLLLPLHPFNGLFYWTTWVSWHQKGKPFWTLLEQEMTELQWHQLDHMQIICTLLQTDNRDSTSPLSLYRMLPSKQRRQSTFAFRCL